MNADATSFADPVDIGRHVDVLQVAERFRVVQTDGAAVTQRDPQADTRVSHRLDPPAVVLLYAEIALEKEKNGLRLAVTSKKQKKKYQSFSSGPVENEDAATTCGVQGGTDGQQRYDRLVP